MNTEALISKIKTIPEKVEFNEVVATIEKDYNYQACRFTNGLNDNVLINESGTNEGSCKIFSFAKINQLNKDETLACFGHYYHEDVLKNPQGNDHGNIRNFMAFGWQGIHFEGNALTKK